jgi:hypothetical protein
MALDDDMQRFKPGIDAAMIVRNCNECDEIICNAYNGERELECFEVQRLRLLLSEIAGEVSK